MSPTETFACSCGEPIPITGGVFTCPKCGLVIERAVRKDGLKTPDDWNRKKEGHFREWLANGAPGLEPADGDVAGLTEDHLRDLFNTVMRREAQDCVDMLKKIRTWIQVVVDETPHATVRKGLVGDKKHIWTVDLTFADIRKEFYAHKVGELEFFGAFTFNDPTSLECDADIFPTNEAYGDFLNKAAVDFHDRAAMPAPGGEVQ